MAREDDGPQGDPESNNAEEEQDLDNVDPAFAQEYEALSSTMDEINEWMDVLERKSNDLVNQMRQLIEESKQGDDLVLDSDMSAGDSAAN
ncbi:uncharacterized protein LOC144115617 [Amblyomma americanum]|uniref:Uncharacterized protein n=1 Tax=Amblyomma americanum TaxID=6943 RepID=A0AAQ4EPJ4_AMBAM